MSEDPPSQPFRFTLRSLFVVMTLFCGLGWLGWCVAWINQRHLVATQLDLPAMAADSHEIDPWAVAIKGHSPWQLRLFGEQGYSTIYLFSEGRLAEEPSSTAEDRERISRLFPEASVLLHLQDFTAFDDGGQAFRLSFWTSGSDRDIRTQDGLQVSYVSRGKYTLHAPNGDIPLRCSDDTAP